MAEGQADNIEARLSKDGFIKRAVTEVLYCRTQPENSYHVEFFNKAVGQISSGGPDLKISRPYKGETHTVQRWETNLTSPYQVFSFFEVYGIDIEGIPERESKHVIVSFSVGGYIVKELPLDVLRTLKWQIHSVIEPRVVFALCADCQFGTWDDSSLNDIPVLTAKLFGTKYYLVK